MPSRPNEWIVRIGLAIAGLIQLPPLPGVLGADALQSLYGIRIDAPDLLLLLQHRALLFGLLAILLLGAIRHLHWRTPALAAGLASTVSFILLALGEPHGAAVQRIVAADVVAVVALVAATIAHRRTTAPLLEAG